MFLLFCCVLCLVVVLCDRVVCYYLLRLFGCLFSFGGLILGVLRLVVGVDDVDDVGWLFVGCFLL